MRNLADFLVNKRLWLFIAVIFIAVVFIVLMQFVIFVLPSLLAIFDKSVVKAEKVQ